MGIIHHHFKVKRFVFHDSVRVTPAYIPIVMKRYEVYVPKDAIFMSVQFVGEPQLGWLKLHYVSSVEHHKRIHGYMETRYLYFGDEQMQFEVDPFEDIFVLPMYEYFIEGKKHQLSVFELK